MDFGHWLSGAAGRHADRVAVEAPDESVTYRELLLRAVRAAGALHVRGVKRGQPVGLALEPGLPFVEALHGCLLLGAPAVPVDPRLAEPRARRASCATSRRSSRRPLRGESGVFQLPEPPDRDAIALIVHTSGTTGQPKPVEITYGNIRANARGLAQAMELGDDERWLCPLPLSHVGGLMVVLRSTLMATTAVLGPARAARREPGITIASLVPTQLQRAARRRRDARPGPAPDPARRRADAARAAGPRPRRRLPGLPELRAHAGLLDGHRRRSPATSRPPAARSPASASPITDDGEIIVSGAHRQHARQPAHRRPRPARRATAG